MTKGLPWPQLLWLVLTVGAGYTWGTALATFRPYTRTATDAQGAWLRLPQDWKPPSPEAGAPPQYASARASSEWKVEVSESQDYRLYTHSNLLL